VVYRIEAPPVVVLSVTVNGTQRPAPPAGLKVGAETVAAWIDGKPINSSAALNLRRLIPLILTLSLFHFEFG
jgi:hypothetical protein